MSIRIRLWVCLLSTLLTGVVTGAALLSSMVVASAQDEDQGLHIAAVSTEGFPIVEVGLTVDGDGPIDLNGFSVEEDGLAVPFAVDRITEPLTVVLALDVSGSMAGDALASAKVASRACLANLPPESQTALIAYNDQPYVESGFGDDKATLESALDALFAEGETATYDALWQAGFLLGPDFPEEGASAIDGQLRRFVVLLSDGEDTVSSISQDAAVDSLQVASASVIALAIETAESNHETLNEIVKSTDGLLLAGSSPQLDDLCAGVNAHLTNRYRLRYESPSRQPQSVPAYVEIAYKGSGVTGAGAFALNVPTVAVGAPGDLGGIEIEQDLPPGGAAGDPVPTPVIAATLDGTPSAPAELPFADDEETAAGAFNGGPTGGIGGLDTGDGDVTVVVPTPPAASGGGFLGLLADFLGSPRAVWAGAGMVGVSIAMFLSAIFTSMANSVGGVSLGGQLGGGPAMGRTSMSSLSDIFSSFSNLVDRFLQQRSGGSGSGKPSKLNLLLDRGGMAVRPAEIVTGTLAATSVSVFFLLVLGFRIVALIALIAIPFAVRAFIKRKAKKRTQAFKSQLGDTLMIMAGSVRAGHSLMRSVSSVAMQSPDPTAEEFNRVLTETRIGRDPIESLTHLAERIDSEDLTWTVRAMALNRELGGNLAEVLDNVGETIRDRNAIADQVRALSSEGKFSAYVLFALPFIVSLCVSVLNRGYLTPLFTTTNGYIVLGIGGGLLLVGAIWIRNLINLEY